jgi:ABC-type sugar transport system permease subunit
VKRISAKQLRNYWPVFLLLIPTFALISLFSYYPAGSAIYHSFFRWDGDDVLRWRGTENYETALEDEELGDAFGLVMIFIAANLVKMTPSILIAVLIHRLASARARYLYRVAFVMPMIIPAMVWLLIWKYFYNPNFGVLNSILSIEFWGHSMMSGLHWLDMNMPWLAGQIQPFNRHMLNPVFGSVWGLGIFGAFALAMITGMRQAPGLAAKVSHVEQSPGEFLVQGIGKSLHALLRGWLWWLMLLVGGYFLMGTAHLITILPALIVAVQVSRLASITDPELRSQVLIRAVAINAGLGLVQAALTSGLVPWLTSLLPHTTVAGPLGALAGAVFLMLLPPLYALTWRSVESRETVKKIGLVTIGFFAAVVLTSLTWTEPTKAFELGRPGWLSNEHLIPTALIFWGFPWVGIVSVLLYLSGLGNIDQSVYEAAEIDGCGWFRKFWNVELPLITTQVRLNLVLMIIGTLKGWGQVYILLGDKGGPNGAGMLPGLYMFRKAFTDGEAGYGCAIGLLLFLLIAYLTLINNKYVRVEK